MPMPEILALRLDRLTAQQLADMALQADRDARTAETRAAEARRYADTLADEFARRN